MTIIASIVIINKGVIIMTEIFMIAMNLDQGQEFIEINLDKVNILNMRRV
jgi:hypothetical protein